MPFTPTRNPRHPIPPTPDPHGNRPAAWHPAIHGFYVIARIPSTQNPGYDVIVVDRGAMDHDRFVTGKVDAAESTPLEWFWGYYHDDLRSAMDDALGR
jgi:hypothetical protein